MNITSKDMIHTQNQPVLPLIDGPRIGVGMGMGMGIGMSGGVPDMPKTLKSFRQSQDV
ncbi:hypothetical protein BGZ79_004891, partial [Entomortierella chlamydospora]